MQNALMYIATSLIWGSTWIAITFQLGAVDPLVSVVYRFGLSSSILLLYCLFSRKNLRYSFRDHLWIGLQGFLLFGINYWLVYVSEVHIPSGLAAVLMSSILFLNMFNGALFLKKPLEKNVIIGAFIGVVGMVFLFGREVLAFRINPLGVLGILLALLAAYSASLGNILSARNQAKSLPIVQTNAYGMLYGTLFALSMALILKKPFMVEMTPSYLGALFYLAIFGSVIAFGCYLTLVGRIGVTKSAYIMLLSPVIALVLSTLFEGYVWSVPGMIGVVCILAGNLLVLRRK
ncbi:MAG TPA: EamA family transporter [Synergistaceae bacterium]|nr:EamA family transporter [Synergistaceae bacterium]HPJ26361.1 EamA family transporter [Synergistaceae bacterium]HPQ36646.1 EamA family transporter [Synergistaceae bacterium]